MLMNRNVNTVVLENSARTILDDGLAYDRCSVAVVTGVPAPAGLEDHHILTQEQMRNVLRTQVDVVLPDGCAVLNADDAACADLAELCDGDVIYYSEHDQTTGNWLNNGQRMVCLHQQQVVIRQEHTITPVLDLQHPMISSLLQHHATLPAVLAAVAAALALDIALPLVRAGMETAALVFPSV